MVNWIGTLFGALFGGGRNVVAETAEVFRENADKGAQRAADMQSQALMQMAAEFQHQRKGWFDRFIDGMNRIPRPAMALGVIGLFVAAMTDPLWFSERMTGLQLVPEPLWWLLGVIVSFYFGARHNAKTQEFQASLASTMARAPQVVESIRALRELRHDSPGAADTGNDAGTALAAVEPSENPALDEWKRKAG